ncbi:gp7 [Bacillus phage G]|uniref:Gp7 n=1 Tax=Bacillus phage G TaxID=2884420 RepID=G3MB77_9CAUD|nr:gp7 [Bacillus phage G]AEO93278.1 gp7 [Bacillus phage G]
MGKFTSSNLFTQNNKESVPTWMSELADNLDVTEKEIVNWETEKRGIFAESQQVYRPEVTADPRSMTKNYNESRLISEAKINLARFLTGKYYKVQAANAGTSYVTLNVKLDSIAADFQFPYEINALGKLAQANTFYANEGEYPFNKGGFEECVADIKSGRIKTSSPAEAVGKAFLINREEIIRRFNGYLRPATEKIDELLSQGVIIGAGSNTYASFHDVDQLFPQIEKQAGSSRMEEFHFAPNKEKVASAEYKTANYLSLDASKILSDYFDDYKIKNSNRDNNELLVKATILGKNGIRKNVDFSFAIENEKVAGLKIAEIDDNRMTIAQLMNYLEQIDNTMLNKYLSTNKSASKHIYSGVVLTKKDISGKLLKVVESSKVDNVIKNWILGGFLTPINSTTYATEYSFQELLANSNEEALSDEQIEEITAAQSHFGEGLEVETDLEKPNEEVREVEDKGSEELKLVNANVYLSKHLKKYTITSAKQNNEETYTLDVNLINEKTGTRHNIPFAVNFDGTKVTSCTAKIGNKNVSIEKLLESFASNEVLSLYLQDKKDNLNAGPIVMTEENMKRKLASVVTSTAIDSIIEKWIKNKTVAKINSNTLASPNSFEELLASIDSNYLISEEEQDVANYQKKHFGKNIKVKTDEVTKDTGVREAEEQAWTVEKKNAFAANTIGKMFKDYRMVSSFDKDDTNFITVATVVNPISSLVTNLSFRFSQEDGKLKNVVAVSDENGEEVTIDKIVELFEKQTSDINKHFVAHNKTDNRIHNANLISKTNLINKLKMVAKSEDVPEIINNLMKTSAIEAINSVTYSSQYPINELINIANSQGKLNIDAGKEQMKLAAGRSEDQTISFSNKYEMATDTRNLDRTVRELTPQMIEAKNRLETTIKKAASVKKITNKTAELFTLSLSQAKTATDLENVAKELKKYLG